MYVYIYIYTRIQMYMYFSFLVLIFHSELALITLSQYSILLNLFNNLYFKFCVFILIQLVCAPKINLWALWLNMFPCRLHILLYTFSLLNKAEHQSFYADSPLPGHPSGNNNAHKHHHITLATVWSETFTPENKCLFCGGLVTRNKAGMVRENLRQSQEIRIRSEKDLILYTCLTTDLLTDPFFHLRFLDLFCIEVYVPRKKVFLVVGWSAHDSVYEVMCWFSNKDLFFL